MSLEQILHQRQSTTDTSRKYSGAVWGDCPVLGLMAGHVDGVIDSDDFVAPGDEDGNDTGGYERYIDTSNTIRTLAANNTAVATGVRGGVLRMAIDATDNDGPVIQRTSANGAGTYILGNTAGAAFKTWFECRVRVSSIADDAVAMAVGLGTVGAAADNGLQTDDTGDIVDSYSFIGFRSVHVNSGTTGTNALVDFVYQDGGQTSPVVTLASAHTLVASTWVKLGFKYDPNAPINKQIAIYVNNVEQSTYVTKTNMDATTFPEDDAMGPVFGFKAGSATATNNDIDWWRIAQVFTGF